MSSKKPISQEAKIRAAVILAALGYFVDVYDLLLFSIVRVQSLQDLGLQGEELSRQGVALLNWQMAGMLIGGVLWGVLGDKKGRLGVLFGSIFLYSSANLANSFVTNVEVYALLRFIAGIGLAGELGAGITLVSEIMPKERRGFGTTIVATVGVFGAIVAAAVGEFAPWRTAYMIGGVLGLSLLALRIGVHESGLFDNLKKSAQKKGSISLLFGNSERIKRFIYSMVPGFPIWFALGILVTFAPEIGQALGTTEPVSAGRAVFFAYVGMVLGDLISGVLSQMLRSRKKIMYIFIAGTALFTAILLKSNGISANLYYGLCVPLGFFIGYWAVFVSTAAEQFGTNLRATVTTTVPNFVRGGVVPMTFAFEWLKPEFGVINSALFVGMSVCLVSILTTAGLKESFGKDLDFLENQ